jgi:hypothetical protein
VARPLKYTVEQIESLAKDYFDTTPKEEWTITGLALALGTNRQTLMNYEDKDEFVDTIKKLKTMVENQYEISLRKNGRSGDIFGLKNFGWKDKSDFDHNHSGGVKLIIEDAPGCEPVDYETQVR